MARRASAGQPLSPKRRGRVALGSCQGQAEGQAPRPGEGVTPSPDRAANPHPTPPPVGKRENVGAGLVLVGEFGRAHGLRGEVRLKSFTDDPAAIAGYVPLTASDERELRIEAARPAGGGASDMLIARIEGVTSREAAEALNRVQLFAHRETFAEPEEDEFFLADLVGLAVEDLEGHRLGTVVAVPNYGGGDLLEIAPAEGGATSLLPFTKAFVPKVELSTRRITIDPPVDFFRPPTTPPEPDAP